MHFQKTNTLKVLKLLLANTGHEDYDIEGIKVLDMVIWYVKNADKERMTSKNGKDLI